MFLSQHPRPRDHAAGAPAGPERLEVSVWTSVLLDKCLPSPTSRLLENWRSQSLNLSQGTITNGLKRIASFFMPLYPGPAKESARWWLWVILTSETESVLWNDFVQAYHYLDHKTLPAAQIRYIAWSGDTPLACLGFGASDWKVGSRDASFCWSPEVRADNLRFVVNNIRFFILPWILSRNLAPPTSPPFPSSPSSSTHSGPISIPSLFTSALIPPLSRV